MPSFISKNGIWNPARERSTYIDSDGQPQIYDGPDRAATKFIAEEGGVVGQDATQDPQVLQASRNMGFPTVEAYLAHFKPTAKQEAEVAEAQSKIVTHVNPEPKTGVDPTLGGFFDPSSNETPDSVMEQKKQRGRPRKNS